MCLCAIGVLWAIKVPAWPHNVPPQKNPIFPLKFLLFSTTRVLTACVVGKLREFFVWVENENFTNIN
jgi:hypothetical protein